MACGEELMKEEFVLNMNAYLPLRDVVFQTLRDAILKGELKPGERLMEMHLADKRYLCTYEHRTFALLSINRK